MNGSFQSKKVVALSIFSIVVIASIGLGITTFQNSAENASEGIDWMLSPESAMEDTILSTNAEETAATFSNISSLSTLYNMSESFFGSDTIKEIYLTFDDVDWYETLYASHAEDAEGPYFPVLFQYGDFQLEIGINMKGHSSFLGQGTKKSFRLDFNEYVTNGNFYGLQKLNLNNGFADPTMLREKLFWDVANQYVPSVRCTFIKLYINGEYYGFYTAVEQIDDVFCESRFGSHEQGNLYRAESAGTLEYLSDDPTDYSTGYELKTNDETNVYSGLIEFTRRLNADVDDAYCSNLEQILDVNSTLCALALLNIYGSLDSYIGSAHNFYLYQREDTGQFVYLLWDANMAFGTFTFGLADGETTLNIDPFWTPVATSVADDPLNANQDSANITEESATSVESAAPPVNPPVNPPPNLPDGDQQNPFGSLSTARPLVEKLLAIPEYNQTYLQFMNEVLSVDFSWDLMETSIDQYMELISDAIASDPNALFSENQAILNVHSDITNQMQIYGLEHFVTNRSAYLETYIDKLGSFSNVTQTLSRLDPSPSYEGPINGLFINEVMAENTQTLQNPFLQGDYSDWIEIYNANNYSMDLSGFYLTDTYFDPILWRIPNETMIAAYGYLLIWADGMDSRDTLETNFKLDGSGEFLALIAPDGATVVDNVLLAASITDYSQGRSKDGEEEWQFFMTIPSPSVENVVSTTIPTEDQQDSLVLAIASGTVILAAMVGVMQYLYRQKMKKVALLAIRAKGDH